MSDLIGKSLGRYHILEQIGEGGMATVYKAYDTHLKREVAIKVIRREAFPAEHHARIFKRFEREAIALEKLSHPHIVSVIEYGEHQGAPFLAMEYVRGGTLKQQLGKPIPWIKALQLLLPIAQALDYAHKKNIIHRDVKPSNILITEFGEPTLTDFGIAKVLESDKDSTLSTTTGVGVGTPEYMAPEQGLGQEVDARADIYSLGIVLFEMITGRKPFRADTPLAVIVMHINDPLPRPRQFARDVPETVEKVLIKALAKKTGDRYGSMAEFGKALDVLLEPIRAKEKSIAQKKETLARQAESRRVAQMQATARKQTKPQKRNGTPWIAATGIIFIVASSIALMGFPQLKRQPSSLFPTNTLTSTVTFTSTSTPTQTLTAIPMKTLTSIPSRTPFPTIPAGAMEGTWEHPNKRVRYQIIWSGQRYSVLSVYDPSQSILFLGQYWKDGILSWSYLVSSISSGNTIYSVSTEYIDGDNLYVRVQDGQNKYQLVLTRVLH